MCEVPEEKVKAALGVQRNETRHQSGGIKKGCMEEVASTMDTEAGYSFDRQVGSREGTLTHHDAVLRLALTTTTTTSASQGPGRPLMFYWILLHPSPQSPQLCFSFLITYRSEAEHKPRISMASIKKVYKQ